MVTFEQCGQEVMTQFSTVAVKQNKSTEIIEGSKMERKKCRKDDDPE